MCYGEKWYVMHKSELGWSIFIDWSHSLKDGEVKKCGGLNHLLLVERVKSMSAGSRTTVT